MKRSKKSTLAASFVVTVSASTIAACGKKAVVDPDPEPPTPRFAHVYRNGERCFLAEPVSCPKGATCNPPAPMEVDCPASHRDAGEVDPSPARPAGKEGWLRVKPHLYVSRYGCVYNDAFFCAPPDKPHTCERPNPGFLNLKCASNDASPPRWTVEPFVVKDSSGACRAIPAFDCAGPECVDEMPAGKPAPCPP